MNGPQPNALARTLVKFFQEYLPMLRGMSTPRRTRQSSRAGYGYSNMRFRSRNLTIPRTGLSTSFDT